MDSYCLLFGVEIFTFEPRRSGQSRNLTSPPTLMFKCWGQSFRPKLYVSFFVSVVVGSGQGTIDSDTAVNSE